MRGRPQRSSLRSGARCPPAKPREENVTTPRNMTRTALALTIAGRERRGNKVAARPKRA